MAKHNIKNLGKVVAKSGIQKSITESAYIVLHHKVKGWLLASPRNSIIKVASQKATVVIEGRIRSRNNAVGLIITNKNKRIGEIVYRGAENVKLRTGDIKYRIDASLDGIEELRPNKPAKKK